MAEEDSFSYLKTFPQVFPVFRVRSLSDTSAFKSRIFSRLRSACSGRMMFIYLFYFLFFDIYIAYIFYIFIISDVCLTPMTNLFTESIFILLLHECSSIYIV